MSSQETRNAEFEVIHCYGCDAGQIKTPQKAYGKKVNNQKERYISKSQRKAVLYPGLTKIDKLMGDIDRDLSIENPTVEPEVAHERKTRKNVPVHPSPKAQNTKYSEDDISEGEMGVGTTLLLGLTAGALVAEPTDDKSSWASTKSPWDIFIYSFVMIVMNFMCFLLLMTHSLDYLYFAVGIPVALFSLFCFVGLVWLDDDDD